MATNADHRYLPTLGWLLHLLALLLIVAPLSQWMLLVWPIHADALQWRFGSVGLLQERLTLPMVGLFTAILAATLLQQRAVQGTLSWLSLLAAPVLAVLAGTLALDGLQLRHTVQPEMLGSFDRSLARTLLVLLYAAVVAAVLGWAGLKARGKKASPRKPTPLVRSGHAAHGPGA